MALPDILDSAILLLYTKLLDIRIKFVPLRYRRQYTHTNDLVAQFAKVSIALVECSLFFSSSVQGQAMATIRVDVSFPCHHYVVILFVGNVCTSWPTEILAAHGCAYHLNRDISRTLERRTATQCNNVGTTLCHFLLYLCPCFLAELFCANNVEQWRACNLCCRSKYCHLFAMAAICTAVGYFVKRKAEILGQFAAQTC